MNAAKFREASRRSLVLAGARPQSSVWGKRARHVSMGGATGELVKSAVERVLPPETCGATEGASPVSLSSTAQPGQQPQQQFVESEAHPTVASRAATGSRRRVSGSASRDAASSGGSIAKATGISAAPTRSAAAASLGKNREHKKLSLQAGVAVACRGKSEVAGWRGAAGTCRDRANRSQVVCGSLGKASVLQGLLLCLTISVSIGAVLTDSFAAAVVAVAVGVLACGAALVLVVAQLATYRRHVRPEHRPILLRFIGALVATWMFYPVVFLLGPGIGSALDTASSVVAFSLLDLLAKNAFVVWVWAASSRMQREENATMRLVLGHGEPMHWGGVVRDAPLPPLHTGPDWPALSPLQTAKPQEGTPPPTETVETATASMRPTRGGSQAAHRSSGGSHV